MAQKGAQKPDHGGIFYIRPRRVTASVAWKWLSFRARAILDVFQYAHDGANNGEIAFGIHDIGTAIGNQNHAANSRAVAELIEKGFLECTSDANRAQAKVRTYRITFISTGEARKIVPATHEYESWRPVQKRKFGGARTATQNPVSVAVTAPRVKVSVAVTAPTESHLRTEDGFCSVAETALILDNHSRDRSGPENTSSVLLKLPAADLRPELDTLRQWVREVVDHHGFGGARRLAHDADVPEPALSRFRSGKSLPDHYRIALQEACARVIPFNRLAA